MKREMRMAICGGITDPELKEAAFQMHLADLDYEEHKGSSQFGPIYAARFEEARNHYRAVKARVEKEGASLST